MGSQFTDWAQATGPMYMGANGIMEVVWTLISVAVCIWALSAGSKHELDAYKKMSTQLSQKPFSKNNKRVCACLCSQCSLC